MLIAECTKTNKCSLKSLFIGVYRKLKIIMCIRRLTDKKKELGVVSDSLVLGIDQFELSRDFQFNGEKSVWKVSPVYENWKQENNLKEK